MLEFWYMLPVAIVFATIALGSGVEGATFFSPFFILVVGLEPAAAIGAGLVTEVFGFGSGLFAYARKQLIDYRMGGKVLTFSIPAALMGTYAAHYVPDEMLMTILGVGLVAVAGSFLRTPAEEVQEKIEEAARQESGRAERGLTDGDGNSYCYTVQNQAEGMLTGGMGGLFIGMVSTGHGELNGYMFMQRCRVPGAVAVATSVFVVAITAFVASVGHAVEFIQQGGAQLTQLVGLLAFTVPGVLIGGQIGPMVSERIPDRWLETGMGGLFLLVALLMLVDVAVLRGDPLRPRYVPIV